MIVNLEREGWEVIYQPGHALLATKLAHAFAERFRSDYFLELLTAIAQHDNHQKPFERDTYLTELGAPQSFTLKGGGVSLRQPQEVVAEARQHGRYVALLSAMHMQAIYGESRTDDKTLATFLSELETRMTGWRKGLGVTKAQAERDYSIMLFCDRLSLILCLNEIPAAGRRLEIQQGPDGDTHYLWDRPDSSLGVDPWPFEGDELRVGVEATYLTQLKFQSDEELLGALETSEVRVKDWRFVKGV